MADNLNLNIATDELSGGVHCQKIKLLDGTADSTTEIQSGNGTATNALRVTVASNSPGLHAEDAAHVSGDVGQLSLAVRKDSAASIAGSDGDYTPLQVDSSGSLRVTGGSGTGDVAHDSADSGNPVKMGSKARATLSDVTLVAANDRTDNYADLDGVPVSRQDAPHGDWTSGRATNTDGTSTECIAAAGSGIKTVLTDITLANSSASAITVDIKDGSTTKWTFPVPAGGGVVFSWRKGLVGSANAAWNFDGSAAATTLTCSMSGYKSKV